MLTSKFTPCHGSFIHDTGQRRGNKRNKGAKEFLKNYKKQQHSDWTLLDFISIHQFGPLEVIWIWSQGPFIHHILSDWSTQRSIARKHFDVFLLWIISLLPLLHLEGTGPCSRQQTGEWRKRLKHWATASTWFGPRVWGRLWWTPCTFHAQSPVVAVLTIWHSHIYKSWMRKTNDFKSCPVNSRLVSTKNTPVMVACTRASRFFPCAQIKCQKDKKITAIKRRRGTDVKS